MSPHPISLLVPGLFALSSGSHRQRVRARRPGANVTVSASGEGGRGTSGASSSAAGANRFSGTAFSADRPGFSAEERDPYKVLGLRAGATAEELLSAYRVRLKVRST